MAKSIRSKRGMALRRIKRERYAKKELVRLQKTLGLPTKEEQVDEEVMEFTAEDDERKGLSSKDYKLLKNIVHDGSNSENSDVEKEFNDVIVMTSSNFLRKKCKVMEHLDNKQQAKETAMVAEPLLIDEAKKLLQRDLAKMVDENGSYPVWMNQRKIRTLAKANRSMKKKKAKRLRQVARSGPMKPQSGFVSDDESEQEKEEEGNTNEDMVMETEDVTMETTEKLPKNGEKKKTVEVKAKGEPQSTKKPRRSRRGKKGKVAEPTGVNSSISQEDVETVDLSDD